MCSYPNETRWRLKSLVWASLLESSIFKCIPVFALKLPQRHVSPAPQPLEMENPPQERRPRSAPLGPAPRCVLGEGGLRPPWQWVQPHRGRTGGVMARGVCTSVGPSSVENS